jgi:hypothetical protein
MPNTNRTRLPFLALAILALLGAIWAGWIRIGWRWPVILPALPQAHGPLMVSGFLGTLIALERAVALEKRWMYASPLLSGIGGLALILGVPGPAGPLAITLGSLVLVAILIVIVRQHPAVYTLVIAAGVACWFAGNMLWLAGWPVFRIVLWWAAFLVLTIAGERLELGRLLRLTRRTQAIFLGIAAFYLFGLILSALAFVPGTRLVGLSGLGMAAWLLQFDIARRTIRQKGLPRFAAVCLLSGYVWLGIGGLLALVYGGVAAGPPYDAVLHSVFVGFVISMIFGHAPIIFPSVLRLPISYDPRFYAHLALLHLSLVLRVGGDLVLNMELRRWGGLLNGIAILLFLASTMYSIRKAAKNQSKSAHNAAVGENLGG